MLQVTITAEQECLYMCWPRLKLERVLRHRPLLKVVLSNIIGEMVQIDTVAQNRDRPEAKLIFSESGMTWDRTLKFSLRSDSKYGESNRNILYNFMAAAVLA
jgi:hypothetical protein